jgi:hypothetical protein
MHPHPFPEAIPFRPLPAVSGGVRALAGVLVLIGIAAVILGAGADAPRMWQALLSNWLFWSSIALGMGVFAASLQLTGANWAWSIRRAAYGGVLFLPISFVLLIPILVFGSEHYFAHWLHAAGDPIIAKKLGWLNLPFLITRDLIATVILYGLALALLYWGVRPDVYGVEGRRFSGLYQWWTKEWRGVTEEAVRAQRIRTPIAVVLALLFAVLWGMVGMDLAMSLEPHWFSTMFPVIFFVGAFHGAIAVTIIAATWMRRPAGLEEYITERQYHDLGKLLFAFAVFWMYVSWGQYIVIWYGQLPHEQEWFIHRFSNGYGPVSQAAVLLIFVIPFFGLLPRAPKLVPGVLTGFAILILVGHWLERYLLVAPSLREAGGFPGLIEIGIGLGFGGLFLAAYLWYAVRVPLLPSPATLAAAHLGEAPAAPGGAEPLGA